MADKIITCAEARAQGLSHYFTGKPCKRGHIAKRSVVRRGCVECAKITNRASYHRPHVKEWHEAYREANKAKLNQQIAAWQKANREKRSEDNRRWYYRDVEHARAVHLQKVHRRRAIKLQAEGSHTKEELAALLERQGHRCSYCRTDLRKAEKHADHIIALSKGGSDSIENIQYLCAPCNLSKGAKDPQDFAQERGLLL